MRPEQATEILRDLLRADGVDPSAPTPTDFPRTWTTFQRFASIPVEDVAGPDEDGDGVLIQFGVYDWGDDAGEHFSFDLTRQFIRLVDDEQAISQLHCTFLYDVTPALRSLPSEELWSFGPDHREYFDRVAATPAFRTVLSLPHPPRRLQLEYDPDVC
jgi:hypothetical protein